MNTPSAAHRRQRLSPPDSRRWIAALSRRARDDLDPAFQGRSDLPTGLAFAPNSCVHVLNIANFFERRAKRAAILIQFAIRASSRALASTRFRRCAASSRSAAYSPIPPANRGSTLPSRASSPAVFDFRPDGLQSASAVGWYNAQVQAIPRPCAAIFLRLHTRTHLTSATSFQARQSRCNRARRAASSIASKLCGFAQPKTSRRPLAARLRNAGG